MSTTAEETTLSVVVPMYNEEAVLPIMAERLRKVLDGLDVSYEVVAVDDGSTDATAAVLVGLRRYWPQLRIIRLRRNGGHQAALTAGLHRSTGAFVVSIDADLQDPPELIKDMLDLARSQNLDIVYGVRDDRSTDTVFKRWTAGVYYRMMRRIAGNRVPHNAGDFRLLSRVTVDALRALPEQQPVYRLLVPWLGFPSGTVTYSRERRAAGETKYPLTKMVRLAADSVTSFSAAPLRIATWLGLAGFAICMALVVWVLVAYFLGVTVPGWASLSVVLLFLGAVQLLCLGLLGEYVGRIFAASQGRPTFFIAYDSAEDPTPLPTAPLQRQPEPDPVSATR
ncbi:glycosyltransferase family 2 protein [Dactylosporangium sp. NPDC051541]|uniref:glycosyltransferase family 2 protein n=1 Tax=Dactylosporangium sp. NPDC051541 TaxID=3363977 RepID=UPI003799FFFF